MSHDFNFAKFHRQPHYKELPSKDEIICHIPAFSHALGLDEHVHHV